MPPMMDSFNTTQPRSPKPLSPIYTQNNQMEVNLEMNMERKDVLANPLSYTSVLILLTFVGRFARANSLPKADFPTDLGNSRKLAKFSRT